ncbi:MAG: c-type cytochrome [Verrucomicrobia bacterium]|nr:c-type cytochrome [Verrucomicrobiota bacterium]
MLNQSTLLVRGLVVAFFFSALTCLAADPDISKLPPAATKQGVTYEKDIKPLFENSCLKCHGAERPKSKYRVDSREATIKGGSSDDLAVVVGKSEKSPIVLFSADLVEEMEMPPIDKRDKYPALTRDQIALIRAWIDQGAK